MPDRNNREHRGTPQQKMLPLNLEDLDLKRYADRNGQVYYYPCSEVLPGFGIVGPHEVAEAQRLYVESGAHLPALPNAVNDASVTINSTASAPSVAKLGTNRQGKVVITANLVPSGEPLFKDRGFARLMPLDRYDMVLDYLKKQNLILNKNGGLRLVNGKSLQEITCRREEAIETLKALYFHCPRQTLTVLFQHIPKLAGPLNNRDTIIDPRETKWPGLILSWAKEYPHSQDELVVWIKKINSKSEQTSRKQPKTAKNVAGYVAKELGWTTPTDGGYKRLLNDDGSINRD